MATRAEPLIQTRDREDHAIAGALTAVDHKTIGVRYMITAILFFCLAGIEAFFIRLQLSRPENNLLSPDVYNQFFTMHGTTMIFFFATPVLFGFGSYLVPLMIGARSMAFPRLNAFGFWAFLFSGLFMYSSFLFGMAPDYGWFAYTPLTAPQYSPGLNLDFMSLGLIFLSISFAAGAVNFTATIFKMQAPGMSLNRIPIFVWAILVTAFTVILAVFSMATANILLLLEHKFGVQFFQGAGGGAALWQHLFWVFGFPELFIVFLPVVGIVSEIVSTFARRPIVEYRLLVRTLISTGILGFVLWAAHVLAVSIPSLQRISFSGIESVISVPCGILIVTWLATLLAGRPVWKTPLLWIGGFIFLFVVGGLTSVMLSATLFGRQLTGTDFGVARLHYMLVGGTVFPVFAGIYYWFPKFFGRMLNERLGKINFWLLFIGFNITFFPMVLLGLEGMPRRMYTYRPDMGWDGLNLIATIGAMMIAESILVFIFNVVICLLKGDIAGDNPWDGSSLEWAAASPPERYNFRRIPAVGSHLPLWTAQQQAETGTIDKASRSESFQPNAPGATVTDEHLVPATRMPEESLLPFLLAASLLVIFVGLLISQYWLAGIGFVLTLIMIFIWLWPAKNRVSEFEKVDR